MGGLSNSYGTVISRHNALTGHGPLPRKIAESFAGGAYDVVKLDQDLTLYRVWHPGAADEFGGYWSTDKPSGRISAIMDSALLPEWGNQATRMTTIRVPEGEVINIGQVGYQNGFWVGGSSQVLIRGGAKPTWKIDELTFTND